MAHFLFASVSEQSGTQLKVSHKDAKPDFECEILLKLVHFVAFLTIFQGTVVSVDVNDKISVW